MKRKIFFIVVIMLFLMILNGCHHETSEKRENETDIDNVATNVPQEWMKIPESYFSPSKQEGTLVELYYDTYESVTYEEKTQKLKKRAIVYLPFDYNEDKKYNIFYLMHGGWGNETTQLGTPENPSMLKNVIDNGIQNGEFEPLIIVCSTYNNTSPEDSANYSLAFGTLTVNYHNELVNDLIPAVEGTYSTHAKSTSAEDIVASRDHRAFGGFSMGSVATWYTFINCLDQFRYFLPMSGAMDYQGDDVDSAVTEFGHAPEDFFIFAITGTDDFEYRNFTNQIEGMLGMKSGNFVEGKNVAFQVKEGYAHDGRAAMEYTYNGLRQFWKKEVVQMQYTKDSKIVDVIADPSFGEYGRLLFPVNENYYSGDTLKELQLTWYNNIDSEKTVEIVNYMKIHADAGDNIFFDIYSEEEKQVDPTKKDTGLFFFKGESGAKFAVCNAGGGFSYVGAMHDSFPHALELSKKGYHAFALIYRPDAQSACEDLARAISFIFEHAEELEVNTDCYSLWGGSAGARLAAYLGTYGTSAFGGDDLPQAGTVVMQYTGHMEYSESDPPTFVCVGKSDSIADWRTMEARIEALSDAGIPTQFHAYEGLRHGFGLGTGTIAEGWLEEAIAFWEEQIHGLK